MLCFEKQMSTNDSHWGNTPLLNFVPTLCIQNKLKNNISRHKEVQGLDFQIISQLGALPIGNLSYTIYLPTF